jgi:hypothetical protein
MQPRLSKNIIAHLPMNKEPATNARKRTVDQNKLRSSNWLAKENGDSQLNVTDAKGLPNSRLAQPVTSPDPLFEADPDLNRRLEVADTLLEGIEWQTETCGVAQCPGHHLHTTVGTDRARIYIDGTATLHCFHQSCRGMVAEFNWELRRQIGRVERGQPMHRVRAMTTDSLARRVKHTQMEPFRPAWRQWFLDIIAKPVQPARLHNESPTQLPERVGDDRFAFLRLFHPDDVIWTGEVYQSSPRNFAKVGTLIGEKKLRGPSVSTASFIAKAARRCRENVQLRRFLVVESDTLAIPQQAALLLALRKEWPLAAVVYSGGKSLHGWFRWRDEWNRVEGLMEAKARIQSYECDRAAFMPTQPFRLPGVLRPGTDRFQSLVYLNLAHSYANH